MCRWLLAPAVRPTTTVVALVFVRVFLRHATAASLLPSAGVSGRSIGGIIRLGVPRRAALAMRGVVHSFLMLRHCPSLEESASGQGIRGATLGPACRV
jgi:hypothetical protein